MMSYHEILIPRSAEFVSRLIFDAASFSQWVEGYVGSEYVSGGYNEVDSVRRHISEHGGKIYHQVERVLENNLPKNLVSVFEYWREGRMYRKLKINIVLEELCGETLLVFEIESLVITYEYLSVVRDVCIKSDWEVGEDRMSYHLKRLKEFVVKQ